LRKKTVRELLLLSLLAVLATYFGVSLCYQRVTYPEQSYGMFENIARDGWLVDGSLILPPYLAARGNRMHVDFHDWRPAGLEAAHLRVYLCGDLIDDFRVDEAHTRTFFLTGECEPRVIRFEVVNPFVASDSDQRQLGIQIKEVRIDSRLGYPILEFTPYWNVFLCIFSITILWYFFWFPGRWRQSACLVPVLGFFLVQSAIYMRLFKIYPVWVFFFSLLVGLILTRLFSDQFNPRAKPEFKYHWPLIGVIILGAAYLRFYGLSFGLPNNFHPDEVPKVYAIMRMVQNENLNPKYFLHPSLLLYLSYFCNSLIHWFGFLEGSFRETAFLAGRIVSATAGTLSVFLIYLIASRLFNRRVGLISGALLAVFPLHITCSRYLKEDALLLFFILASIFALIKAVQEDRKDLLLFSGLLAGFSASVKYSGILTVGIVACAPWLRSRSWLPDKTFLFWTVAAGALAPMAFIIGTPYSVISFEQFAAGFNYEKEHMARGHTIAIDAWSQYWTYHLERSIFPAMTKIPTFLALIGVGILLRRRRIEDLFLIGLIFLYYLPAEYVKAKPAPQPERYIYPCLPFLAVAGAVTLNFFLSSKKHYIKWIGTAVLVIALIQPMHRSVTLASEITDDTRERMARWMKENLPKGSKVYIDLRSYNSHLLEDDFDITYSRSSQVHRDLTRDELLRQGQDYLLLSSLWWDRYFSQPRSDAPVQKVIREVFRTIPIEKEITSQYGTYGFHNPTITLFSLSVESLEELDQELMLQSEGKLEFTSNELETSFYGFREKIDY